MSAEQLVDTLFQVAGKEIDCEPLNMDPENRQPANDHTNLGVPHRAWEFIGLSNERDRPALAKPRAQVVTDVLATFGWRESRAEPRTARDHDPNVLQPALLANGDLGGRIMRLSDDTPSPLWRCANSQWRRSWSRFSCGSSRANLPSRSAARFVGLLIPGYEQRRDGLRAAAAKAWQHQGAFRGRTISTPTPRR